MMGVGVLERQVSVDVPVDVERLYEVVADLGTYSEWLDIVSAVETADGDDGDPGPAWTVTLRAEVGRFARTKRLRIVRTHSEAPSNVRFERRELDGRDHADWIMTCVCTADPDPDTDPGSSLDLDLVYTGGLWSTLLDTILGDEISQALDRLPSYLTQ